jgi:hypothetical protein
MKKTNNSAYLSSFYTFIIILLFVNSTPSSASPVIDVWYGADQYFGHLGNPQIWINVLGNVSDPQRTITSLDYSLNGGLFLPLSIGSDTRRLYDEGDFCIEILYTDLQDGINEVVIRATNDLGQVTEETVTVHYEVGNVWPLNFTTIYRIRYRL